MGRKTTNFVVIHIILCGKQDIRDPPGTFVSRSVVRSYVRDRGVRVASVVCVILADGR